ncbi:MAG: hypothetical protein ABFR90_10090 [Planctomycetota bacterium]
MMDGLAGQYEPTLQTDWAMEFMTENKDNPFFCFVSWGPPHTPYDQHLPKYSYKAAAMTDAGLPEASTYGGRGGHWRGVVKGDHKLVIGSKGHPTYLYNLKDDPREQTNLVSSADCKAVKTDLLAEYKKWKTKTSDPFPAEPTNVKCSYPDPA